MSLLCCRIEVVNVDLVSSRANRGVETGMNRDKGATPGVLQDEEERNPWGPESRQGRNLVSSRANRPCLDPRGCAPVQSVEGYLTYKETHPLGPYRRPMPSVLGGPQWSGRFLMGEVPLYTTCRLHVTSLYKGSSLIRRRLPLGHYSRPTPKALWWS